MKKYRASEVSSRLENKACLLQGNFFCPKCKNTVHSNINIDYKQTQYPQVIEIICNRCGYEFKITEG